MYSKLYQFPVAAGHRKPEILTFAKPNSNITETLNSLHSQSPFKKGNLCLRQAASLLDTQKVEVKESFSSENVMETIEDGAGLAQESQPIIVESSSVTIAKKGNLKVEKPDPNSKVFALVVDPNRMNL